MKAISAVSALTEKKPDYIIPAASFNNSPSEFQHFRIAPGTLGGDYENLKIGDICVINTTDPTAIKETDNASNTTNVDLPTDFPLSLANKKNIILGPQK